MQTSKFLAKVIGIYLLVVSCAMLLNMEEFTFNVSKLNADAPLLLVAGFFTLILGILLIVAHNVWRWNWRVLITIIGWITFLKGASIILYPHFINHATVLFLANLHVAYAAAGIDLLLGLMFCYFGFKRI